MVCFAESSKDAVGLIRKNLESLQIGDGFEILSRNSAKAIADLERRGIAVNFVFLDPPYRMTNLYRETLEQLASTRFSAKALVIVEHEKNFDPGDEFGCLRRIRNLRQGDSGLSFYKRELSGV